MSVFLSTGLIELASKEYENAVSHCKRSLEIATKNGDKVVGIKACLALGEAHCALEHHDEALMYVLMSIEIVDDAETYCALGEYEDVIYYCRRALNIAKQNGDKHVENKSCLVIAKVYKSLKNYDKVIEYARRCIGIAKETDDKENEMQACRIIMETYESLKQYKEAVQYAEMYLQVAKETRDKSAEINSIQCCEDGCYEEAILNDKKRLQIAIENGNRYAEMDAYLVIGESKLKLKLEEYIRSMEMKNGGVEELEMKDALAYGNILLSLGIYDKEFNYGWWSTNIGVKPCQAESRSALGEYEDVISYCTRALNIAKEIGDKQAEIKSCLVIAKTYWALRNYDEAIEYARRCIDIANETGDKHVEMEACLFLTEAYKVSGDCQNTIQCALMLHVLAKETDDKENEMQACFVIMKNYESLQQYKEAVQYAKMYLEVVKETGDKRAEMETWAFIAIAQHRLTNYTEAVKYAKMSLEVAKETGDKNDERDACLLITVIHYAAGNYTEALKYGLMSADVAKEIGDKRSEIHACLFIGSASRALESYDDVIQYATKRMTMEQETDDQGNKEIGCFLLGHVDCNLKTYDNAVSHFRKAIDHAKEEGDEYGEMAICSCLGEAYMHLDQLDNAISYYERSLQIAKKIGDKKKEMNCSLGLSDLYEMLNRSDEVESPATIALEIAKELGDKEGQKKAYLLLGDLYSKSGQGSKAIACLNECVDISKETGDFFTEMNASAILLPLSFVSEVSKRTETMKRFTLHPPPLITGDTDTHLFKYPTHDMAMCLTKYCPAGFIKEAIDYLLQYTELPKYFHSLIPVLEKGINDCPWEAEEEAVKRKILQFFTEHEQSGIIFHSSDEFLIFSIKFLNTARDICGEHNDILAMLFSYKGVAHNLLEDIPNAKASFMEAIRCFESIFDNLHDVDKSKISIVDRYVDTYKLLSNILIEEGNTEEALLVAERCRAKALKDILVLEYGLNKEVLQEGLIELDDILPVLKTHKSSILFYTVYSVYEIHKFVMEDGKSLHSSVQSLAFPRDLEKLIEKVYVELDLRYYFRCKSASSHPDHVFQMFKCHELIEILKNIVIAFEKRASVDGMISEECNWDGFDDSLEKSFKEFASFLKDQASSGFERYTLEGESSFTYTSALETLSQMLLGNVSLEQDEVVIVPDGLLSIVPFAALTNPATGRYLSEDKKIRLAPSLSTLKVLSESREDFHTLKGAIFIGDPDVSTVIYNGKPVGQLQNAEIEVTLIASKFDVTPLIGAQATKSSVLQKLHEGASVVHIAAHGDLDKATIFLAPGSEVGGVPREEDYMLTMADVQQAQVRAQLVVLSCCYSGRGEIRAEGVVGMCRAFLASGARAVLASLWSINDEATLEFMLEFYDRLELGESASTSLQMAMKYLRNDETSSNEGNNKTFSEPKFWAPFFLMGDDVKITF